MSLNTTETNSIATLVIGEDYYRNKVTVLSGQNELIAGTVLGKVKVALHGTPSTYSGTGNGAMTGHAIGKDSKIGNYTVRCITAATNGGVFAVFTPTGERLADATVGAAYSNSHLGFTIADGSTDFIVGDTFTVTMIAGSGKYKKVNSAATDSSAYPDAILLEAVNATDGDAYGVAAFSGVYNEDALVFGGSDTKATHREALRNKNIFLETIQ